MGYPGLVQVLISIDMDNYRDYRGLVDPDGDDLDVSFYESVPRFLELLDRLGARATFFMIGRDAEHRENRAAVQRIAAAGHEVGNHSFDHPYDFHNLSRSAKERQIVQGEAAIADILGRRPRGFRTPSGDIDLETLEILEERDYLYDSSVIPSPLLVWSFMVYGKLFVRHRNYNLGRFWSVLAPPQPYLPSRSKLHEPLDVRSGVERRVVEIPYSVVPGVRVPFYATLFRMFPPPVFDAAVRLHGRRRPTLHTLFHLIDLYDLKGTSLGRALERMPGLAVPFERRCRFVEHAFERMTREGEAITLEDAARHFLEQNRLAA